MNIRNLNQRGVAHHFAIALVVVGIISAFAFQQVAGSAVSLPDGGAVSSKPKPVNNYGCTSRPLLGVGNAGPCVKLVQSKVGVTADGNFGPKTKSAVIAYQKKKGLAADGVVGPNTWKAMLGSSSSNTVTARTQSNPSPLAYCSYTTAGGTNIVNNEYINLSTCKGLSGIGSKNPQRNAYRTASLNLNFGRFNEKKLGKVSICASVKRLTTSPRSMSINFGSVNVSRALASDVNRGSTTMTVNGQGCRQVNTGTEGLNEAMSFRTSITAGPYTGLTSAYMKAENGKVYQFKLSN